MTVRKMIQNNKLEIMVGLLAVFIIFFAVGAVVLATGNNDSLLGRAYASIGFGTGGSGFGGGGFGSGNRLPSGWHDYNANQNCGIVGWAADPDSQDQDVSVNVYSGTNLVGSFVAGAFHPDLADLGICPGGLCGISAALNLTGTHNIVIKAVDNETGQEVPLQNTGQTITCGVTTPPPTPAPCTDEDARRDIVITSGLNITGTDARISVRNNSSRCTHNLKLDSYSASMDFSLDNFEEFLASQTLYRSDAGTLAPGASRSFRVEIPLCTAWQVDLVTSGGRAVILASDIGGRMNSCPVNPPPTSPDLSVICVASDTTPAPGDEVTFTAQVSGGNGTYLYSWTGDIIRGHNQQTAVGKFHVLGSNQVTVTVSSGGQIRNATCNVMLPFPPPPPPPPVNPPPLSGSCVGIPSQINVGQSVNWNASATGGTGSYTFNWSGAVSGSGASQIATYNTPGTKTATVLITSGTQNVTANCSINVVEITISTPPLGGSCEGIPSQINVGQSVNWTAQGTGGTGSYTYSWSGAVSGNAQTINQTYSTPGTQSASVIITSGSQSVTRNCQINVVQPNEPVLGGSCQGTPSQINVGQSVNWIANGTGGTGSYTYSWSGAVSGNSQNVSQVYNSPGTQVATVIISSGGISVTRTCQINVVSNVTPLDGSCSANPANVGINQTVNWSASASGGTGNYTYSWSGDASGNSSSVTNSYSTTGTKTATVIISSPGSASITRTCNVNVSAPSLGVSCSASGGNFRIGDTITWMSNPSGGTGNYTYSWSGTDGLSGNSQNVSRSYSTTGTKTATVVVTSGTQSNSAICQVTISDQPVIINPLTVSCSANPSFVTTNQNVTWNSNVSGGTGIYNYYWSGTDNLSGNNASVTRSYDTPGTKSGTIVVTSGGQSSSAVCNVVVSAPNIILNTQPVPNPLTFVYLNQVPYTGLMDDMGKVGKMFMLISWSALVAFAGLKFLNRKNQFAFAGGISEESGSITGTLRNILTSIIPGAVASPYVEEITENSSGVSDEEEVVEESEEEEADEAEVADIEALSTLAMDRKALISRQALQAIYNDYNQDFEEASLDLIKVIGAAALSYPREDGWIVLNSERLQNLRA